MAIDVLARSARVSCPRTWIVRQLTTRLFGADPGVLHHARPLYGFGRDEAAELVRAHRQRFGALALETLLRLRRGDDRGQLLVQPIDDRPRRAGGHDDFPPIGHFVAGDAGLRDRRQVGKGGYAVRAADSPSGQGYTELSGRVTATFLRGSLVYDRQRVVGPARGRYLSRPG